MAIMVNDSSSGSFRSLNTLENGSYRIGMNGEEKHQQQQQLQ